MADWSEHAHIVVNNGPIGMVGGVSTLAFDHYSELLWAGTSVGQVVSHFGPQLSRYTSYPAHGTTARPAPTKAILVDERQIYSVGENGIKCSLRRGIAKWSMLTSDHASKLALSSMCASPLTASSDLIAGGSSLLAATTGELETEDDVIITVNNNTGSVIRKVASEAPLLHLRKSARLVCAGTMNGHVQLRDPRSLKIEHRLHAHPGGLIDLQAEGNLVYSVGWTVRQGHPVPEPLIKVHDIRTMRALVPIPFAASGGPALLAIHPKLSSTVVVSSSQGQFQIVDIGNPGEGRFFQLNSTSFISSLSISPSADFIAFGETDGSVRLWSSSADTSNLRFNPFSTPSLQVPDLAEPPPSINWSIETPLSSIAMPYYSDTLLSYFDYDQYTSDASPLFNPPSKTDPMVLGNIKVVDFVGYAPLPRHLRGKRNVITGKGPSGAPASASHRPENKRKPLFRSVKEKELSKKAAAATKTNSARDKAPSSAEQDDQDSDSQDTESTQDALARGAMPSYYRLKTIQYSKFGIEDFDFAFYNKTPYSGLETHIQNSYANSYLQALHYLIPFRMVAKAHILQNCSRENCLLCEAGFLFRMLEDAKGVNCQATNFLRAFGNSHRAATLGLMDKEDSPSSDVSYSNLVQSLNRFVLESAAVESQSVASKNASAGSTAGQGRASPSGGSGSRPSRKAYANSRGSPPATSIGDTDVNFGNGIISKSIVSRLFALHCTTKTICVHCGRETHRSSSSQALDLSYPRRGLSNEPTPPSDFASVLRASMLRETQSRSLCRGCQFTSLFRSRRVLPPNRDLPRALNINAAVHTAEQLNYWLEGNRDSPSSFSTTANRRGTAWASPNAQPTAEKQVRRSYLPPRVAIDVRGDDVRTKAIYTDADLETVKSTWGSNGSTPAIYKLRSMVVQIQAEKETPHLCAIVRVPEAEKQPLTGPKPGNETSKPALGGKIGKHSLGPWYLFNDFLVRNISEEEALLFPNPWKIPAVLMFEREDIEMLSETQLSDGRTEIDPGILCQDVNISWNRDPQRVRYEPLSLDELPKPGTLVAIDTEFVALNQEELEIRSDGTRSVIRPTKLSLARVSVLRGQGPKEGKAFIDDHIFTQEEVVDYLTKFSGINPGDLDPATSKHTLVPLKVAYKKLRILVDCGCIFIGHGLKKDFRIINIHVPSSQVIDTVELYHSATYARKLSLRFLSWFLLKIDIQNGGNGSNSSNGNNPNDPSITTAATKTMTTTTAEVAKASGGAGTAAVEEGHDSIEDALAALRLFRLYEVFERDQRLDDVMEDLYEQGRRLNWKPPAPSPPVFQLP